MHPGVFWSTYHAEKVCELLCLLSDDVCHSAALNIRLEYGQVDKRVAVRTAGTADTRAHHQIDYPIMIAKLAMHLEVDYTEGQLNPAVLPTF